MQTSFPGPNHHHQAGHDDDYSFAPPLPISSVVKANFHLPSNSETTSEFRPRYSVDESSNAAFEKDLQHHRLLRRKRGAFELLFLIIGVLVLGVIGRVYMFFASISGGISGESPSPLKKNEWSGFSWARKKIGKESTRSDKMFILAKRESFGFFNEIPAYEWMKLKHETKERRDAQNIIMEKTSHLLNESGANVDPSMWWIDNWKVSFSLFLALLTPRLITLHSSLKK